MPKKEEDRSAEKGEIHDGGKGLGPVDLPGWLAHRGLATLGAAGFPRVALPAAVGTGDVHGRSPWDEKFFSKRKYLCFDGDEDGEGRTSLVIVLQLPCRPARTEPFYHKLFGGAKLASFVVFTKII